MGDILVKFQGNFSEIMGKLKDNRENFEKFLWGGISIGNTLL